MGDTETADQLIREAELRKAVADAERAEAQARKARLDARASSGESHPGGEVTADERSGYPATLAAYRSMEQQAGEIARAIEGQCGSGNQARVLIVDSLDLCGPDVQAMQVSAQLDVWLAELDAWTATLDQALQQAADRARLDKTALLTVAGGVAAAVGAAGEMVGLTADVIGYFRTGYDVKGQTISLSNTALQAMVAGRVDRQKCSFFLPSFHRLESPGDIPVMDKLNCCIRRRDRLKVQAAALRSHSAGLKGREDPPGTSVEARGQASEIEAVCKKAEQVLAEFAEFNEALVSPPKGGGSPPLAVAVARHYLEKAGITHLLYLGVASSGGDMVLGQGPFHSGKAGYLGGCVITYILARCSGEIVGADTLAGHSNLKYDLGNNELSGPGLM